MERRKISKYHLRLIILYLVLIPILFILFNDKINYSLNQEHIWILKEIFYVTFLFLIFFFLINRKKRYNLTLILLYQTILYAFIIAFAEEIIFRGIIQGFIQNHFNIYLSIIFSSLIFGLAHIPNKAKGRRPENWNWKLALLTFLIGLPLGAIFAVTKSLLIPTLLHAIILTFSKLFLQNN